MWKLGTWPKTEIWIKNSERNELEMSFLYFIMSELIFNEINDADWFPLTLVGDNVSPEVPVDPHHVWTVRQEEEW